MHLKQKALAAAFIASAGLSPLTHAALMSYTGTGGNVPGPGVETSGLFSNSITVADAGVVNGVSITLNDFSHTWIGDIFATLVFDDGTNPAVSMILFGTDGTVTVGSNNDADGTYTFATGGATGFEDHADDPIPSGTYAPLGSFSVFNNLSAAGMWTLNLDDQSGGDSGFLESWTLNIDVGDAAPIPAPATLALFGLGLAGLGWSRRKKSG